MASIPCRDDDGLGAVVAPWVCLGCGASCGAAMAEPGRETMAVPGYCPRCGSPRKRDMGFRCVSSRDFGRSIAWARGVWRNPLDALVRARIEAVKAGRNFL